LNLGLEVDRGLVGSSMSNEDRMIYKDLKHAVVDKDSSSISMGIRPTLQVKLLPERLGKH